MNDIDKESQQRLADAIDLCVQIWGSLREASKQLEIDVAYLSRLKNGKKTNPSDEVLRKLGLCRVVSFVRIQHKATPLALRTKSA